MDPDAVEECLKKNREVGVKLDEATRVIQARLDLIRTRIREIDAIIHLPTDKGYTLDGEIERKIQFTSEWNDIHGFPPNSDTIAKRLQTGLPHHPPQFKNRLSGIWTPAQSRSLCSIIHKFEVQERVIEYSKHKHELRQLNIQNPESLKISILKKEIAEFDLNALKQTSLEELVANGKGIYDWEKVSHFLQRVHTPLDCKTRWFQYLHPSVNKASWSKDEDLRLTEIAERRKEQDWEAIASELNTGRSAYSCFITYQSRLRGMQVNCTGERIAQTVRIVDCAETGLTRIDRTAEAGWTREDDCALAAAVTKSQGVNGIVWAQVMDAFPHKSRKQLFARWSQVLDPSLRKGNLTYVEQKGIIIGTRRFGLDFGKIRNKLIPHRTISQIRHYTLYRINNCSGRGKWTLFAERVFRALIEFMGPGCWREVQSFFPYNSVIQLKRRYNKLLNSNIAVHSNIYILPKQVREALSEPDLETCKLIDHWEKIKPLSLRDSPATETPAGQPIAIEFVNTDINCDTSSSESDVEADEDSILVEPCQPGNAYQEDSNQVEPCQPGYTLLEDSNQVETDQLGNTFQEDCLVGSSEETEELTDDGESDEISVTLGCKRRRGRPPSKKKKKERTKPKRSYVRSGQYKILVGETAAAKRSLRQKRVSSAISA